MEQISTLQDVSVARSNGTPFNVAIKEFLDGFILAPSMTLLISEPRQVENDVERVYLAGTAEYLASFLGEPSPQWTHKSYYFLLSPVVLGWHQSKYQNMIDTPSAYRRRLLFCGQTLTKLYAFKAE